MKLKFVADEVVNRNSAGRKAMYPWAEFFEELYKFPNQWAVFPHELKNAASAYGQAKKFKGIEVRCSQNKETDLWVAYFRFVPEDEVF